MLLNIFLQHVSELLEDFAARVFVFEKQKDMLVVKLFLSMNAFFVLLIF